VADDRQFDDALLNEMVAKIGRDFALAGQGSVMAYIGDERVSPTLLTMAVVRAHLLGAASMMAAHTDGADGLDVAAWLLEAFVEARLAVGSFAAGASQ